MFDIPRGSEGPPERLRDREKIIRKLRLLFSLLLAAILAVYLFLGGVTLRQNKKTATDKLTIAVSQVTLSAPIYVAHEKGYFRDEGLDVRLEPSLIGKEALENVTAGRADIGTCAETPVVMAVLEGKKLQILSTIADSEKLTGIMVLKDRPIRAPVDLKHRRIGFIPGTISDYFLSTFLLFNDISKESVDLIPLKAAGLDQALRDGKIDAASMWQPRLALMQRELGSRVNIYYSEGLYRTTWNIIALPEFVHTRPDTIKKILRALIRAEGFITENPDASLEITSRSFKIDKALLAPTWKEYYFSVSLSQALVVNLEDQARWAISSGLTKTRIMPNFLNAMYREGLAAVDPARVTLGY